MAKKIVQIINEIIYVYVRISILNIDICMYVCVYVTGKVLIDLNVHIIHAKQ